MKAYPSSTTAVLAAMFIAAVASPATANGVFPSADQIVFDPAAPSHAVVRTTYGLLTTQDGGASWDWICELAIGYDDTSGWYPPIAISTGGKILAALLDGLAVGSQGGCAWRKAPELEGLVFRDLSTQKGNPSHAVAIEDGPSKTLWESLDGGESWARVGVPLPNAFQARTLDVAPSDPARIYVGGLMAAGGALKGHIASSVDHGQTWKTHAIPGSTTTSEPFIGGLDPANPDVVYVRLAGAGGRLFVSTDAANSWKEVFHTEGFLRAFAVSPDGSMVAVGSDIDGVWRAPSATLLFEKVSTVASRGFAWTASGLYTSATEFLDGFTLGRSVDGGAAFEPLLNQPCIRGPLLCAAGTPAGDLCPPDWPRVALLTGHETCVPDPGVTTSSGAGGAGGAGGSNNAGGAGGTSSAGGAPAQTGSSSSGQRPESGADSDASSCACRTGSDGASWTGGAFGLAAALCALARRRKA